MLTRLRDAPRWFAAPVRHMSNISYATYLVHYPLAMLPILQVVRPSGERQALAWYAAYYAITLLLSYALHYGVERPGLEWRKRLSAKWAREPARRRGVVPEGSGRTR
jgi:peptidoglycan/LPS O-acetylase OafA/YrhL